MKKLKILSLTKNTKGFTLIEVLISLFLFSVISVTLMNSVTQITKYQKQIQRIIKKEKVEKNVSQILKSDIQMIFTSIHANFWISQMYVSHLKKYEQSSFFDQYLTAENKAYYGDLSRDLPNMGMIGEKNQVIFTSFSQNLEDQLPLVKIKYFLEDCPSKSHPNEVSKCLQRTTSKTLGYKLEELDENTKKTSTLLHDIKNLEFSYCGSPSENTCQESFESQVKGIYFPPPFPYTVFINVNFKDSSKPALKISIPIYSAILSAHIIKPTTFQFPPPHPYSNNKRSRNAKKNK